MPDEITQPIATDDSGTKPVEPTVAPTPAPVESVATPAVVETTAVEAVPPTGQPVDPLGAVVETPQEPPAVALATPPVGGSSHALPAPVPEAVQPATALAGQATTNPVSNPAPVQPASVNPPNPEPIQQQPAIEQTSPASPPSPAEPTPTPVTPLNQPAPTLQSRQAGRATAIGGLASIPIVSRLIEAYAKRRENRQKKLDKIIELAQQKKVITNNDVELLVHVSDSTATRYLNSLVREGKLRKVGKHGGAKYELMQ